MTSDKKKTVRQWLETIPTINKVDTIQKYLDKELSSNKPRQTIVKAFNERIELLTIKSKDVAVIKDKKVEETITHTPNIITPTNTIENVLIPFKNTLEQVNIDALVWKDVYDKEGYTTIKQTMSALVKLRTNVELSRKNLNAPFSQVISSNNEKASSFVAEIKHYESILKERKVDFDNELVKLKQKKEEEKAKKLLEEQRKAKEIADQKKAKNDELVKSDEFLEKYGDIIKRAKDNLTPTPSSNGQAKESGNGLLDKITTLTDKDLIEAKIQVLESVVKMNQPDSESYLNMSKIIDKNVLKIIAYVKNNL